jgi:hypothetical protein
MTYTIMPSKTSRVTRNILLRLCANEEMRPLLVSPKDHPIPRQPKHAGCTGQVEDIATIMAVSTDT